MLGGPGHALLYPSGMEVTPTGDLVVADTGNDSVAKFSPSGTLIWRVSAGVGAGDEAENARDIAVDDSGNIYVADAAEFRIIKLDPNGAVLGTWNGPPGDRLGSPIGITAKSGKVYVADGAKKKVRVFDESGKQLATFVTTGACNLAAVRDADADPAGNLYVANYTNNNIAKFSPSGACLKVWGTKGSANGQFKNPYGVRVAKDPTWGMSVYVADSNNNRIQVFTTNGVFRATVGTTGSSSTPGTFTTLRRVAVDKTGAVWGADLWGWRLVKFTRSGGGYAYSRTIGGTQPPLTDTAVFNEPRAVAVGPGGTLNVIDTVNQRVVSMTATGRVTGSCGERDSRPISVNWPRGVAVDPVTGDRWVADTKQSRLQIFPANCSTKTRLGAKGSAVGQFVWPYAISIRPSDRLAFVADTQNLRVTVWDVATRTPIAATPAGMAGQPRAISVTPGGTVVVADSSGDRVVELSYSRTAGFAVVSSIKPTLTDPEGVAVDNQGRYWIADTVGNRVLVVDSAGAVLETISSVAGKALSKPTSITVDGATVYVSDTNNDRVLKYVF